MFLSPLNFFPGFSLPGSLRPLLIRFAWMVCLFRVVVITCISICYMVNSSSINWICISFELDNNFYFCSLLAICFAAASNCNHISARNKINIITRAPFNEISVLRKRNNSRQKLKLIMRINTRLSLFTWGCIFRGILLQGVD